MVLRRRNVATETAKEESDTVELHTADEAEASCEEERNTERTLGDGDSNADAEDGICDDDNIDEVAIQGDGVEEKLKSELGAEGTALDGNEIEMPNSSKTCTSEFPGKSNARSGTAKNSELNLSAEPETPAAIETPAESAVKPAVELKEQPPVAVESKKRKRHH